jgi:hypothetical protein
VSTEHNINVQRLLLLSKGYTEGNLHRPNEPRLFLATLAATVKELETRVFSRSKPLQFTARLQADFENGSFPVQFDFGYEYDPRPQTLIIKSLEASLFGAQKRYPIFKQSTLPTAHLVLKELKARLREQMKTRVAGDRKHSRRQKRL